MIYLEVLLPIFRVLQLFGFVPFTVPFDMKNPTQVHDELKWKIYNGILIVSISAMVVYNITSYEVFLGDKSTEMVTYLSYMLFCGVRALAAVCVIESTFKKEQQIVFLQQLGQVNEILVKDLGIELDYMRFRRNSIIWLTLWCLVNIVLLTLSLVDIFNDEEDNWIRLKWIFLIVPLLIPSMKYYQIILYIELLGAYFQTINHRVEKILLSKNRLSTQMKSVKKLKSELVKYQANGLIHDEIVSLRRIYHTLWKSTAQLNLTFRWSLLLAIGSSSSIIVVNYYRTLVWLIVSDQGHNTERVAYFIWALCHNFFFIKLSSVCYNVSQEVGLLHSRVNHSF